METNVMKPLGMALGKEFDTWQESYTSKMIGCVPHYLTLSRLLTECLPSDHKPNSILDLGAGNGNSTAAASVLFPEAHFTLVEVSGNMIHDLRNRFRHLARTSYVQQYMQDTSFPDSSFDLILASFSLHHLDHEEKQEMIANIARWLKPGGIFSYADLFINFSHHKLEQNARGLQVFWVYLYRYDQGPANSDRASRGLTLSELCCPTHR